MSDQIAQVPEAIAVPHIYKALDFIQRNINCPKNKYMPPQGNMAKGYYYRTLDGILESYKLVQKESKTILTMPYEIKPVEGSNSVMTITATLLSIVDGSSIVLQGDGVVETSLMKMSKGQIIQTAFSYTGKTVLGSLFLLDDGVDVDSVEDGDKPITSDLETAIRTHMAISEDTKKAIVQYVKESGFSSLKELTILDATKLVNKFNISV